MDEFPRSDLKKGLVASSTVYRSIAGVKRLSGTLPRSLEVRWMEEIYMFSSVQGDVFKALKQQRSQGH